MQLDNNLIRTLRNKRAWSQNQLAEVAGLSLRTIQRIEKDGSASLESVKSLASVFEVNIDSMLEQPSFYNHFRQKLIWVITPIMFALVVLSIFPVSAKSILVDVEISSNKEQIAQGQLLSESGKESEMRIDGHLRIIIKSIAEDNDNVRLHAMLYAFSGNDYQLIATPELVTKNNKIAEIKFEDYTILLTPHL